MSESIGCFLKKQFLKIDPDLLFADGYDDCISSLTFRDGVFVVIYSADAVVAKLAQDMSEEEAHEFFEFNIEGAYVGKRTPIFWFIQEEMDRIHLNDAIERQNKHDS